MSRGRQPERFLATILFTDIVGSTDMAARVGDREWRRLIAAHQRAVRSQLKRYGGREIDTAGDGFLASFDQPAQAVRAADAIVAEANGLGLGLRAGVHTGECEMIGRKVGGIAVHIAARVMAAAGAGEVLVSSTVRDLVSGSGLAFEDRGVHELKGVPDQWHLYSLVRQQPDATATSGSADVLSEKRSRSTRMLVAGALAVGLIAVLGGAAVFALINRGNTSPPPPPGPNTVVTLDGAGHVSDVRAVPAGPNAIAVDGDTLWIASLDAGVISSLPTTRSGGSQQSVGRVGRPTGLAVGSGLVWGADAYDQTVTLIDAATGSVSRSVTLIEARDIAFAGGTAWTTDDLVDQVHRLDGFSGDLVGSVQLDAGTLPGAIAATDSAIWVANAGSSTVTRIDPATAGVVAGAIPLRYSPSGIAATASDVWIASNDADSLLRLDPASNLVAETSAICDQPTSVAADGDTVWVACGGAGEVWHLDHDGKQLSASPVGGVPTDITASDGQIFVTVRR
jgi:class 3 adenylate cyclase/DNA-binding beta-propeller fold protein YncE